MWSFFYEVFVKGIKKFFENTVAQIVEINQKYAVPQIKTSKWTNFALLMLRFYLILLIAILFYKFFTLLKR